MNIGSIKSRFVDWLCRRLKDEMRQYHQISERRYADLRAEFDRFKAANATLCADIGVNESTTIVAATGLGGGKVEIIRLRLRDLQDFNRIVSGLRESYGPVE